VINRYLAALAAVASVVACKSETPNAAAAAEAGALAAGNGNSAAVADTNSRGSQSGRVGGGGGGGGGGRGGPGGRPIPSITLASSDVAVVKRENLEAGIPITGDLHPIETVGVRARIEGDLVGVYVREGQHVSAGQVLARFESSEQETSEASARADVSSAQNELETAQWNLDQSKELFKAGAISERDLKISEGAVETARAKLAAANSRLRTTSNVIRDTRVIAPTTGIIEKKLVETGERVTRGQQLFSLVRNDALELAAAVPARQANAVAVGQAVHFVADGREFDGRVARVSPTIDPASRSVTVYIQVPNANGALKGGTFASGRVVQRTISNALVVATPALRQSQETGQTFVYRIANRAVDIANVQLGVIDERAGKAEVLSGLNDGDRVIIGNVGTLGRGMQVTVLGTDDQSGPSGGRRNGRRGGRGPGGENSRK
jgi:RND family efflux transporter MFP subunit